MKSRADISERNKHRYEKDMIDIPNKDKSSDRKINDEEFAEFGEQMDGIIDQPYGIKLISIASDTSPYLW